MDVYEGKCTCGDEDCARTLMIEPVYRVTVADEAYRISATEFLSRAGLLDWLSSDSDCIIQDARNELSIEPDAGDVWQWLGDNEAAELRRQLAEAQAEIAEFVAMRAAANAAIAEAADLHRQVDKLREQLLEAAFIPRFFIK